MESCINRDEEGVSSGFVEVRKHFLLLQLTREVPEKKEKKNQNEKIFLSVGVGQHH